MSKMLATFAVLMLAVAGQASAATNQDFRSPDARPALVSQDYRSPDARVAGTAPAFQDLRSPDAQPGGAFQAAPAATASETSGSFNWAYLAIVVTIPLLLIAGYFLTLRRGRHGVAVGS